MLPQKNPNAWSCLPTAFAIALDVPVETLIALIGHDGSEVTHAGLPEPLNRRGFHPQELIKILVEDEMAVTRIELAPTAASSTIGIRATKSFNVGGWSWFKKNLFHSEGVIECRTAVGTGHAMAYLGMGDYARIYDPASGDEFVFRAPQDAEHRDRFLIALWRLEDVS